MQLAYPAEDNNSLCPSCRLNRIIPDLSQPGNLERWHQIEKAKRRVLHTIQRLGLPTEEQTEQKRPALWFSLIGQVPGEPPPNIGHLNGLIVINIAEADEAEIERRRVDLREPYRTLLGHVRHEMAHYYWDRLIAHSQWLDESRKVFGDETMDYGTALQRYYASGPPNDWPARHVSAYASAHPLEDWAETCAHYFHITDMMETAHSFGVKLEPKHPAAKYMTADPACPFDKKDFEDVLRDWFPLTYALNAFNRGMGLHDIYPFAVSEVAVEKLKFVHQVIAPGNC